MYFKLEHLLNKLSISFKEQEPLTFTYGGDCKTSVTIRPLTAEEKEEHKHDGLLCTALTEEEPSGDVLAIFERLANNLMHEGFKKPKAKNNQSRKDEYEYINNEGRIEEEYIPPASLFPEYFQIFESQLLHELSECIKQTAKLIRWRNALNSTHNPVRFTLGLSWSFDGQDWRVMPLGPYFIVGGELTINFQSPRPHKLQDEVENLIRTGVDEPLGHELFLEALQNQGTSPRSALIIGIAAAEVGFKQCVGKLVPDAEWLANHVPSPPLTKMLSEYLPSLPAKLTIQGRVLSPPKSIRATLNKGVEARNKTTHIGSQTPNGVELNELLLSVRDLLYLLDFYCGFEWAFNNIRQEVREAMIEEHKLKDTTQQPSA